MLATPTLGIWGTGASGKGTCSSTAAGCRHAGVFLADVYGHVVVDGSARAPLSSVPLTLGNFRVPRRTRLFHVHLIGSVLLLSLLVLVNLLRLHSLRGGPLARAASRLALEDGIEGVRSSLLATTCESKEIIGLREVIESESRSLSSEFINSSVGVGTHACARLALAAPASALLFTGFSSPGRSSALLSLAAVDALSSPGDCREMHFHLLATAATSSSPEGVFFFGSLGESSEVENDVLFFFSGFDFMEKVTAEHTGDHWGAHPLSPLCVLGRYP